jgi:hypothetical protein
MHGVLRRRIGAVASWLKTSGSRPHSFNASRRCVPDVSAYDAGCHFIKGGEGAVGVSLLCAHMRLHQRQCLCAHVRLHQYLCLCARACVRACHSCECLCLQDCACAGVCVRHARSRLHSHLGLGSIGCPGTAVIGTSCSAPIVAGMVALKSAPGLPRIYSCLMTGCFDAMHATQLHLVVAPPSAFRNSAPSRKAGGSCMLRPSGVNTE